MIDPLTPVERRAAERWLTGAMVPNGEVKEALRKLLVAVPQQCEQCELVDNGYGLKVCRFCKTEVL